MKLQIKTKFERACNARNVKGKGKDLLFWFFQKGMIMTLKFVEAMPMHQQQDLMGQMRNDARELAGDYRNKRGN